MELLLVLVILSILAAIVIPRFAGRSEGARITAARADINGNLATALDLYELDAGRYPATSQGLTALLRRPDSPPLPLRWNGPYIRGGQPQDPWGNPYQYEAPSTREGFDYDLRSMGPDGTLGTADDITNGTTPDETD